MKANIYWIPMDSPGRIGIMPRPRGGDWLEDEILALRAEGVDIVVSLLTSAEIGDLELTAEAGLCLRNGIGFCAFAIEDRSVPAKTAEFIDFLCRLASLWAKGKSLAIHCRMGVGRSALTAACLLSRLGIPVADAFGRIAAARGCSVPDTQEQRDWVENNIQRTTWGLWRK